MKYTQDNPKTVQAEAVEAATYNGSYVNVVAYNERFEMCRVGWSNPTMAKDTSDVLVQNSRGDWLRVWFYDKDVQPFK